MARRDAIKTVTEDVEAALDERPKPKPERRRYPSDTKTPAVACRLPRENYDALKELAAGSNLHLATVVKAILVDWLEKNSPDRESALKSLVTREITPRHNS